jgi:hypothetical protein
MASLQRSSASLLILSCSRAACVTCCAFQ